jgi:hypothetical protein
MAVEIKRFDHPDERRTFDRGALDVVTIGGMTLGRARYDPGWVWSQHVGKAIGKELCDVEHVGLIVSGRCVVKMEDGTERELGPGDLFHIPPGHDSWVVGEEPYVSLHLMGAERYARKES